MLICSECNRECFIETVDFGIGPYEYWGAVGCDVQLADVSDCCEADVIDFNAPEPPDPNLIPESEVKNDHEDMRP